MLTRLKMRLLHKLSPICNERLAGSLAAEVLRNHIRLATHGPTAEHEWLDEERLDVLKTKKNPRLKRG